MDRGRKQCREEGREGASKEGRSVGVFILDPE